jgi:5-methylcytosine-specific restriction endonuclease McrA
MSDNTKRCSKCGIEKDRGEFSKDANHKDGLCSRCKSCWSVYHAKHRAERIDSYIEHRTDRLAYAKAYRSAHREERLTYDACYYAEHKTEAAAYKKQYNAEHREKIKQRNAQYQKTSHGKTVHKACGHRRRTRKLGNGGNHTAEDIKRQGDCQRWKCWWCGKNCQKKYHVDHLVPLAKGGHNNPSNIVIACPKCNLSKHDKLPCEWMGMLL